MSDVGVPTLITLPNSGAAAVRKHVMTGNGGRLLVTCLTDSADASNIVYYAIDLDAATPANRSGSIPAGAVEREVEGAIPLGSYVSFYAGADFTVQVQETADKSVRGTATYAGGASTIAAVDLVTAAVDALNTPGNAFVDVDTTNVGAGPTYYPGATGITMDGYKNFSFTGKMIEGDAEANVLEVQVTNDEDTAGADWQTVYFFDNISNTWVANYTSNANTVQMAASMDMLNFRYMRFKFVGGASATNTLIIKGRATTL